ncbi:hypothetical protein PUN28_013432 [Cardiocondyla obscurior]|uniref:Uncharacterized protein n=1 Tax=Cardiocondyla obscurior TaxID=286306 RepID=A0AAW2F3F1_9HYME
MNSDYRTGRRRVLKKKGEKKNLNETREKGRSRSLFRGWINYSRRFDRETRLHKQFRSHALSAMRLACVT